MKTTTLPLLFGCLISLNTISVSASVFHKWVDSDGITHYSDTLPESAAGVSRVNIKSPEPSSNKTENNFYSIENQWKRVNQERIEAEKLKQEAALLKQQKKLESRAEEQQVQPVQEQKQSRNRSRRSETARYPTKRYQLWPVKHRYKAKKHKPEAPVKRIGDTG